MSKLILLSTAAVVGAAHYVLAPQGTPVELQTTSPGTAQTGHLNITGTATVGLLKSQGTVFGASTAPTGFAYGGFFTAASNQGRGFYGYASSPTGLTYGGFFQNASDQGRAVFGLGTATTGLNYGGYFQTASSGGRAVFGVATSATGTTFGVYGRSNSPSGFGVFSEGNIGTTGIISGNGSLITNLNATNLTTGTVPNVVLPSNLARLDQSNEFTGSLNHFSTTSGRVVIGPIATPAGVNELLRLNRNTADFAGMYVSTSTGGRPYYGYTNVTREAFTYLNTAGQLVTNVNGNRMAVAMDGNVTIGGLTTTAPYQTKVSITEETTGSGTLYVQNGSTNLNLFARQGVTAVASGDGTVIGINGLAVSTDSSSTFGIRGVANGTGINTGIFGQATAGTTNFAGYFNGYLFATSSSSGVKSFMIDHPLDPENKVLTHSSVESDERMNLYRGLTKTDAQGYAWIAVPDWFEALNKDFQYQLTVVDTGDSNDFVLAKVVTKLKNQKFRIRTSLPNVEVNWMVSGVRHDPVSNHRPLEVERLKVEGERGRYYDPEAYGQDPSKGVTYVPATAAQSQAKVPPASPKRK